MNLLGQPAYVGRHCGSNSYDITREVVDFYADALDDHMAHIGDFFGHNLAGSEEYDIKLA